MPFPIKLKTSLTSTEPNETEQSKARNGSDPYFPPPPNAVDGSGSSGRIEDSPSEYPLTKPPTAYHARRGSSTRYVVGYGSQSRRRRLQNQRLPAIKLSPRHWILISLLFLSFLTLVLGFIFADCVTLPYRHKQNPTDGEDVSTLDTLPAIIMRQADRISNPDVLDKPISTLLDGAERLNVTNPMDRTGIPSDAKPNGVNGDIGLEGSGGISPDDEVAKDIERLGFNTPKNLAILFFYTATLPLLTALHTITELALLWWAKRRSSSTQSGAEDTGSQSDSDSISKLKPLSLSRKHSFNHSSTSHRRSRFAPFLPAVSLTISTLLAMGWITINAIQLHCEIHVPATVPQAEQAAAQMMCPIQLRGHFMHGIHELGIARNVVGWIVVVVYIGYAVWCARINGLVSKAKREQKKRRAMEGSREEQLGRSIVRISVEENEDEEKKGARVEVKGV